MDGGEDRRIQANIGEYQSRRYDVAKLKSPVDMSAVQRTLQRVNYSAWNRSMMRGIWEKSGLCDVMSFEAAIDGSAVGATRAGSANTGTTFEAMNEMWWKLHCPTGMKIDLEAFLNDEPFRIRRAEDYAVKLDEKPRGYYLATAGIEAPVEKKPPHDPVWNRRYAEFLSMNPWQMESMRVPENRGRYCTEILIHAFPSP